MPRRKARQPEHKVQLTASLEPTRTDLVVVNSQGHQPAVPTRMRNTAAAPAVTKTLVAQNAQRRRRIALQVSAVQA